MADIEVTGLDQLLQQAGDLDISIRAGQLILSRKAPDGTVVELNGGDITELRNWSPKVLGDWLAGKITELSLGSAAQAAVATDEEMISGSADVLPTAEQVRKNHVAAVNTISELGTLEPAFDWQQVSVSSKDTFFSPNRPIGGVLFVARFGDYSTEVNDDESSLTYVPFPSDPTGATGAWVRIESAPAVYDVLIVYGQSNSVGLAATPVADISEAPQSTGYSYNYDAATSTIVPISNTMNHVNYDEEGPSTGNSWTAFANEWQKRTGRGLVVLSAGRGGKTIAELAKGTAYYTKLIAAYSSTVSAMSTQGLTRWKTYFVFHQGENDQLINTRYTAYKEALKTLSTDILSDIPDVVKFGIAIVGCPSTRDQITWQRIQSAQYAAANESTSGKVSVIYEGCPTFSESSGQYNPLDGVHYSQKGYNEMGIGMAAGLSAWEAGQAQSAEQERSRLSPLGVGFAQMHHASATVSYTTAGSSYALLKKTNSPSPDEQYYPSFFDQIESSGDSAIRVRMGIAKPVVYDMAVTLDPNLISNGVRAVITRYKSGEFYGFDVTFYADIDFIVSTSTGAILGGAPPAANSYISSIVSATVSGGVATLTHSPIKSVPTVSYYSSTAMESGNASIRSDGATTTRVSTTGTNNAVKVGLKNVKLTRAQLQELGDFKFTINATVSDEVDRV